MTDFEKRVWDIVTSEDADHVKIAKIRKLYAPKIDPTTCSHDRLYKIIVSEYETIGGRMSNSALPWVVRWRDDSVRFEEDNKITVLGEYRPEDEHIGRVYERIEYALEDGMGQYTVLKDCDGESWTFDSAISNKIAFNPGGVKISNRWAPFTVLHWVPKKAGE